MRKKKRRFVIRLLSNILALILCIVCTFYFTDLNTIGSWPFNISGPVEGAVTSEICPVLLGLCEKVKEIPEHDMVMFDQRKDGNSGRLYIPKLKISVALYRTTTHNIGQAQKYVDDDDSAAIFEFDKETCIADHASQTFRSLSQSYPGLKAYIRLGQNVYTYICTENSWGTNNGHRIATMDGRDVAKMDDESICIYTCDENGDRVFITLWRKEHAVALNDEDA